MDNERLDDDEYCFCSNVESMFFALKHCFVDRLRDRTWIGQFRARVPMAAARIIGLALRA